MATTPMEPAARGESEPPILFERMLQEIEERLVCVPDRAGEEAYFDALREALRQLHARLRMWHAAGFRRESSDGAFASRPELIEPLARLERERPQILGDLDRLIRTSEYIADAPLEDRDVFVLRVREFIATLRRHKAEEDRLFFLAAWRDTGGES